MFYQNRVSQRTWASCEPAAKYKKPNGPKTSHGQVIQCRKAGKKKLNKNSSAIEFHMSSYPWGLPIIFCSFSTFQTITQMRWKIKVNKCWIPRIVHNNLEWCGRTTSWIKKSVSFTCCMEEHMNWKLLSPLLAPATSQEININPEGTERWQLDSKCSGWRKVSLSMC